MKIKELGLEEVRSVDWNYDKECIQLIDQRLIPFDFQINDYITVTELCKAIKTMVVRGAPAIGSAAAYGIALAVKEIENVESCNKKEELEKKMDLLLATRPTAVDLANFVFKTYTVAIESNYSFEETLLQATRLTTQMIEECKLIGTNGLEIIEEGDTILTHCNAGPLATVDHGTALAPIIQAHRNGIEVKVFVDETRPRLQGARITAWELEQEGIEHEIIADSVAAFLMSEEKINKVILGADRCLLDGTVSNKIGTYSIAVNAKYHDVPFYSSFPWSTIDQESNTAEDFKIELRPEEEVKYIKNKEGEVLIANPKSKAFNPAFDITPPKLITGYITAKGVLTTQELVQKIKEK
ncbi:MAG: S-methyl-5-thioribose-1-phosphate isomerase [Candidatus Heimdallarchaeota archaeon]|nr:S-methyl-5-thioribose-1-phosphate isomerase [Candidatus Heimdallarchaeota archaeon]